MSAKRLLVDTGVFVALHRRDDPRHGDVARWFAACEAELHTVEPVLAEAAFFMSPTQQSALARLAAGGRIRLHALDGAALERMADLFQKYADREPDWADLALVRLAESSGIARIATLDVADFSVYRIHGRKRFELELLR